MWKKINKSILINCSAHNLPFLLQLYLYFTTKLYATMRMDVMSLHTLCKIMPTFMKHAQLSVKI